MPPIKSLEKLVDELIENDIDAWAESKWREPVQLDFIESQAD